MNSQELTTPVTHHAFNIEEIHLFREWFDSVQDLAHKDFLEKRDYVLAKKVYTCVGMRVPDSINEKLL